MAIKDVGTDEERYKSRFVVQGHRDKDKPSLVHSSSNLRQDSTRVILAISSMMKFPIWTQDVSQAYLLGSNGQMRDFYIRDKENKYQLKDDELLKFVRPLYGLSDSGDRWFHVYREHHLQDLGMVNTIGDISFYWKKVDGKLCGLSGAYVDDTLQSVLLWKRNRSDLVQLSSGVMHSHSWVS